MKVLIAEDDAISRKLLHKMLTASGFEVHEAKDGLEAWELLQEKNIRLLLTDLMMPNMDGFTLCRKIRSAGKEAYTFIIALTAENRKEEKIRILEIGADDYVAKPFDPAELKMRIKTGLRILQLEKNHRDLQETLIASRNKLTAVFDSLQEEILAVDENCRVVSINKVFIQKRGICFSDAVGRACMSDGTHQCQRCETELIKPFVQKAFETGTIQSFLDKYPGPDGKTVFREMRFHPVKNEKGKTYQTVIVITDVTESRQKTEQINNLNNKLKTAVAQIRTKNESLENALIRLKDSQAQILQSEKMASIGQLAAGIAHEINNPTGFVNSNLKTLMEYQEVLGNLIGRYRHLANAIGEVLPGEKQPPDISRCLAEIAAVESEEDIEFILGDMKDLIGESHEGTERIKKIVMDMKEFAHPGEGKLTEADINKNLESTLNIVRNELKYKAEIIKEYGDLPRVPCYPQELNQVFMNLLVNAGQAIEEKGRITVTTKKEDGHVEITISDTGAGIPEANLSKIFDPFFTTKGRGKGTGLGLATVYGIVKQNNGFINVYSEPGLGTAINIYLPRHEGEISDIKEIYAEEIPTGKGETILLVEDDWPFLKLAQKLLHGLGYTTLTANSPTEALTLAGENGGRIDLLVTDVIMPDMDGRELVERMVSLYPGIKHMYMSGYTADIIADRGVLDQGARLLHKPFSKRDLAVSVRLALDE